MSTRVRVWLLIVLVNLLPSWATAADPAPVAAAPEPPSIRLYGTLKASVDAASAAVESYSQQNAVAITAAGNPALADGAGSGRLSFQSQQSRFGLLVGEGGPVRGQLELDFIDFTKAGPTTASLPRLRIAKIEWAANDAITLAAGQDWDLAQPVNPHGSNLVGSLFLAGNAGFMRQQVKLAWKRGAFELAGAAGQQGNNNTARDAAVELAFTPTLAVRGQYSFGKDGKDRIGASAIGTSLLYKPGTADEARTFAGAAGVFGDLALTPSVGLRFEGYAAQNGANLGLLTISQGRAKGAGAVVNVRETGGFVSLKASVHGPFSVYAQAGGARVLNDDEVVPSYAYAASATTPAIGSGALASTGPGIKWNVASRLGVEFKPAKALAFTLEGFWYRSLFARQPVDDARVTSVGQAFGSELAALLSF